MKLRYVPALAALLIAAGCSALDSTPDARYAGICVDPTTNQRVDDDRCGDFDDQGGTSGGFFFMWIDMSTYHGDVPAVGRPVPRTIGSRRVPAGTPIAKGVPRQGGSLAGIQRGGFGVKAGSTGGSGGS